MSCRCHENRHPVFGEEADGTGCCRRQLGAAHACAPAISRETVVVLARETVGAVETAGLAFAPASKVSFSKVTQAGLDHRT